MVQTQSARTQEFGSAVQRPPTCEWDPDLNEEASLERLNHADAVIAVRFDDCEALVCRECAGLICETVRDAPWRLRPLIPFRELYPHIDREELIALAKVAKIKRISTCVWFRPRAGGSNLRHRWKTRNVLRWLEDDEFLAELEEEWDRRRANRREG